MPHPLDLVALLLGIFFTLRQMESSSRRSDAFPGVSEQAFERWRLAAKSAYRLGGTACFGKVLVNIAVAFVMQRVPMPVAARYAIGVSLDLGWVALIVLAFLRSRRAHAIAREAGIERRSA